MLYVLLCRCCRGWTPPRWSWWFRNKKFQTWLSSQTTFVQSTLPWHQSLGASLIRLYSWLMEWLVTTQMVMVVWKQKIWNIIVHLNNFCYYNFALKSLLGVPLIRLYSWLLEWLDTTQMVMVVWKQWIWNVIIHPNHFCYHNFVLKSLTGHTSLKLLSREKKFPQ